MHEPDKAYFITMTTVGWIDIFTRKNHKLTIVDSLKYCQKEKGLEIFGWVLMHSHLHLICRAAEGYKLSDILRDFKKYTPASAEMFSVRITKRKIPTFAICPTNTKCTNQIKLTL
jgi:REP element-mobilizing transposase RayT